MGRYLITGRSGSGKSSICHELQQRGYPAFDGDKIEGLAGWVTLKTNEAGKVDYRQPHDNSLLGWNWNDTVLREFLEAHHTVFLCGSADNNQLAFHKLFDKVFVLILEPETQRRRLLARTEHDYGKVPEMQEKILGAQKTFVREALALGAVPIDAMVPIPKVT